MTLQNNIDLIWKPPKHSSMNHDQQYPLHVVLECQPNISISFRQHNFLIFIYFVFIKVLDYLQPFSFFWFSFFHFFRFFLLCHRFVFSFYWLSISSWKCSILGKLSCDVDWGGSRLIDAIGNCSWNIFSLYFFIFWVLKLFNNYKFLCKIKISIDDHNDDLNENK